MVKKCKVYCKTKNVSAQAVIIDRQVLLPVSRRNDIEPIYEIEGQCYYPPLHAVCGGMHFDLMPFSTECDWGEYGEKESMVYIFIENTGGIDFNEGEKWGYCDVKTGQICIAPEMGCCDDFDEYGHAVVDLWGVYNIIDTKGEPIIDGIIYDIKRSHHGVIFFYQSAYGWSAFSPGGYTEINCSEVLWDGFGGFTIIKGETYGIFNPNEYGEVIRGLTVEPTIVYEFPTGKKPKNLLFEEPYHSERFRLIQRDDKFGLVRDVLENPNEPYYTYSELILEPIYNFEDIPVEVYCGELERRIWHLEQIIDELKSCKDYEKRFLLKQYEKELKRLNNEFSSKKTDIFTEEF